MFVYLNTSRSRFFRQRRASGLESRMRANLRSWAVCAHTAYRLYLNCARSPSLHPSLPPLPTPHFSLSFSFFLSVSLPSPLPSVAHSQHTYMHTDTCTRAAPTRTQGGVSQDDARPPRAGGLVGRVAGEDPVCTPAAESDESVAPAAACAELGGVAAMAWMDG